MNEPVLDGLFPKTKSWMVAGATPFLSPCLSKQQDDMAIFQSTWLHLWGEVPHVTSTNLGQIEASWLKKGKTQELQNGKRLGVF